MLFELKFTTSCGELLAIVFMCVLRRRGIQVELFVGVFFRALLMKMMMISTFFFCSSWKTFMNILKTES